MKHFNCLTLVMALMMAHSASCQPAPVPSKAPSASRAPSSQDAVIEATTGVQQPVTTTGPCRSGVFVPWEVPEVVAKDRRLYPDFDNLVLSVDNIYTNSVDYYYKTIILCCGSNVTFGFSGSGSQSLYLLDSFRCPPGNRLPASGATVLQSATVLVGDQIPVTLNRQGQFYFADLVPGKCARGKALLNVTVVGECPAPPTPPPLPPPPASVPLPPVSVAGNTTSRQAASAPSSNRTFGEPAVTANGAGSGTMDSNTRWQQPSGRQHANVPVMVHNTLTNSKVQLVGSGNDPQSLTWYTCGPTVYDSAHLGHAKNYVSCDIIRRVLEDYFGYNILMVMNVTDVEDKIVYRARRNYLLDEYRAQHGGNAAKVLEDIVAALDYCRAKQTSKAAEMEERLAACLATDASNITARQKEDLEDAVKDEQKKLENMLRTADAVQTAPKTDTATLLKLAGDVLAEHLDSIKGDSISDLSIFRNHAARFEQEFLEDLDALGCRPPDVLTRVSEYIPEIVEFIERVVANGMAYEARGSVYFDTQAFGTMGHQYGKLHPNPAACQNQHTAAMLSGETMTGDKRHPADFALWKARKPGEPFWESPWGPGRPGWHIECSAMASAVMGAKMDIHSGGEDLRFPHHNNELAQSEAYYHEDGCHQWVNYFLHMGHLGIEGLKMSKSLKNFITIREALQEVSPRQLRLMFVCTSWDKRMAYGPQLASEVAAKESLLRNFFANCEVAIREHAIASGPTRWEAEEATLATSIAAQQAAVHAALCNNIDTGAAMDALCELVRQVNVYLAARLKSVATSGPRPQAYLLRKATRYVSHVLSCFGVVEPVQDRGEGLRGDEAAGGASQLAQGVLDALTQFRDSVKLAARGGGDPKALLAMCDELRDLRLVPLGVQLEDRPDGTASWKLEDAATLAAAVAARSKEAGAARLKKVQAAARIKRAEVERFEKLVALPTVHEALGDKYKAFDRSTGAPTHDKEGAVLEGKALAKAVKDWEKQRAVRAPLEKRLAEEGEGFLDTLRQQLAALEAEAQALEES